MTSFLQCPQPKRPLKRKIDLLEHSDDEDDCQQKSWQYKRHRCPPTIPNQKVLHWLQEIGPPCRPRSDSYLVVHRNRHLPLPDRISKSSQLALPTDDDGGPSSRQPLTPLSLPGPGRPTGRPRAAGDIEPSIDIDRTSSQVSLPESRSQSTSTSKADSRRNQRVRAPVYRNQL